MSGELSCSATNEAGEDLKTTQLIVVDATRVLSDDGEDDITRDAGDSLTLNCDVEADDNIADTVTKKWFKDGFEIGSDLVKEESVVVPYLMAGDSGEYRCDVNTAVDEISVRRRVTVTTQQPDIINLPSFQGKNMHR